jgi:hypothetical protein
MASTASSLTTVVSLLVLIAALAGCGLCAEQQQQASAPAWRDPLLALRAKYEAKLDVLRDNTDDVCSIRVVAWYFKLAATSTACMLLVDNSKPLPWNKYNNWECDMLRLRQQKQHEVLNSGLRPEYKEILTSFGNDYYEYAQNHPACRNVSVCDSFKDWQLDLFELVDGLYIATEEILSFEDRFANRRLPTQMCHPPARRDEEKKKKKAPASKKKSESAVTYTDANIMPELPRVR